jgi:hypothetical protein
MILWGARPQNGPLAPPGDYQVRVTANGETKTAPFRVTRHPALTEFTDDDLREQFRVAMRIRDKVSAANEAVIQIRDLKAQVADRGTRAGDRALSTEAARLTASLGTVEEALYQVRNRSNQDPLNFPIKLNNKLAALQRSLETGDMKPSAGVLKVFEELSAELAVELQKLDRLLQGELTAFNRRLEARKLAPVEVKPRTAA